MSSSLSQHPNQFCFGRLRPEIRATDSSVFPRAAMSEHLITIIYVCADLFLSECFSAKDKILPKMVLSQLELGGVISYSSLDNCVMTTLME